MENLISDNFQSIQSNSDGLFKDRGSKFLSFAFPVTTENEVKIHLRELRKEYHDAKHHCYAYRLGVTSQYRINDDGEPSGTAGKPIYGQILSYGLTNVLIVVVRYFGGTLLGTSGLINAYRSAALACIVNATVVTHVLQERFVIHFSYVDMKVIMRMMKEEQVTILEQQFESDCILKVSIRKSKLTGILERLGKLKNVRIEY
jgi:uncharacterized YigZ family protein